jgi:hypothetical protein
LVLHEHYRWTPYWSAAASCQPPSLIAIADLITYRVFATDGELGRLDDLTVEGDWWTVVDLVVAGRHSRVEVSVKLIGTVDQDAKRIDLNVERSEVRGAGQTERIEASA